jgi:histidyl-tRNA synthetase
VYYKKHLAKLAPIDRERLKTNALRILDSKEPDTIEINQAAPKSIDYLTNSAKKHFKTVLEHLEELGIPYRINHLLVRGLDYYTHTVFEIVEPITDEETGKTRNHAILGGGRYDYLANQLGHKKEIPAVGMAIGVERVLGAPWWKKLAPRIMKQPKVYFIQLGFDAKLKSLAIMDDLRKAKISVMQALTKDKLSIQLAAAEKSGVSHVLIYGQREALDKTIILRDLEARTQKVIKISDLIDTLKKIK